MQEIEIKEFDYPLEEKKIAKYPLEKRERSKLLFFDGETIHDSKFANLYDHIPPGATLVFNNTKVIRARMQFFKSTGARIEIFCLEPHSPADYERAFAATETCEWVCLVGNLKKWKGDLLETTFTADQKNHTIKAERVGSIDKNQIIRFSWDNSFSFGQMLELLGTIPIPPYLNRGSEESDNTRYQTVYSKMEGSVAAPTAGLHFTEEIIASLHKKGFSTEEVTLHVGAGTFLPVKESNALNHTMHTEHFSVSLTALKNTQKNLGNIISVGTTSARTLESISVLGYRVMKNKTPNPTQEIGQWEAYDIPKTTTGAELLDALIGYMESNGTETIHASTRIMITREYSFKIIAGMFTNFHQPQSTLLLLINAVVGDNWRRIYNFALNNEYRFLSYGDSSLLLIKK